MPLSAETVFETKRATTLGNALDLCISSGVRWIDGDETARGCPREPLQPLTVSGYAVADDKAIPTDTHCITITAGRRAEVDHPSGERPLKRSHIAVPGTGSAFNRINSNR